MRKDCTKLQVNRCLRRSPLLDQIRPHGLGFGGVAGTAITAAKIVFVVALVAFAISGVLSLRRRPF